MQNWRIVTEASVQGSPPLNPECFTEGNEEVCFNKLKVTTQIRSFNSVKSLIPLNYTQIQCTSNHWQTHSNSHRNITVLHTCHNYQKVLEKVKGNKISISPTRHQEVYKGAETKYLALSEKIDK